MCAASASVDDRGHPQLASSHTTAPVDRKAGGRWCIYLAESGIEGGEYHSTRRSRMTGSQLDRAAGQAGPLIERLARFGFAIKGIVTILIGALALRYALGQGGEITGPQGAIELLVQEPLGKLILGLLAAGLGAYALWMFVEALLDPERKGRGLQGLAERGAFFVTGVGYVILARATVHLLFAHYDSGGMGLEDLAAIILTPGIGRWTVGVVGGIVMIAGLFQLRLGVTTGFRPTLRPRLPSIWRAVIIISGGLGYITLGVLSLMVGYSLIQVALRYEPSEAGGWDEALWLLVGLVEGRWLLGLAATGLICYGFYSVLQLRYRTL
jgi:hypothetical protein